MKRHWSFTDCIEILLIPYDVLSTHFIWCNTLTISLWNSYSIQGDFWFFRFSPLWTIIVIHWRHIRIHSTIKNLGRSSHSALPSCHLTSLDWRNLRWLLHYEFFLYSKSIFSTSSLSTLFLKVFIYTFSFITACHLSVRSILNVWYIDAIIINIYILSIFRKLWWIIKPWLRIIVIVIIFKDRIIRTNIHLIVLNPLSNIYISWYLRLSII